MKRRLSKEKIEKMRTAAWFISNNKREKELIACAEKLLTKCITLQDLIKLNKPDATELGINLIVIKSAAEILEDRVKQLGYTYSKREYEIYFDQVEGYEILKLKEKVIERVRELNWVDDSILEDIQLTNELKLKGKYDKGDGIEKIIDKLRKKAANNKEIEKEAN